MIVRPPPVVSLLFLEDTKVRFVAKLPRDMWGRWVLAGTLVHVTPVDRGRGRARRAYHAYLLNPQLRLLVPVSARTEVQPCYRPPFEGRGAWGELILHETALVRGEGGDFAYDTPPREPAGKDE